MYVQVFFIIEKLHSNLLKQLWSIEGRVKNDLLGSEQQMCI